MVQFYFLSILINIIAGLILVYGDELSKESFSMDFSSDEDFGENPIENNEESKESIEKSSSLKDFNALNNKTLRFVIGICAVIVAIIKIFAVFKGDIPVVGDLLPVIAGLLAGGALLIEYVTSSSLETLELPTFVENLFVNSRKYIGVLCLIAGLLHFIFPQVVIF